MDDMDTKFVMTSHDPKAILKFGGKEYKGYVMINHGDGAMDTQQKVLQFARIANCHPPLTNNYLVFDTLPESLNDLLVKTTFLTALRSSQDLNKQLFKSLALVSLRAYEKDVIVDTTLENIYCTEDNTFIFTKCIALTSEHVEFVNWKNKIIAMYENIKNTVGNDEPMFIEYDKLTKLLESSNTPEDFRSNLRSWVFWTTENRVDVIYKITGMTTKWGLSFADYCDGGKKIVGWRQKMSQDALLEVGVNGCAQNPFPNRAPDSVAYKNEEVLALLIFLRASVSHFCTFGNGTLKTQFKSEEEYVRYLDMSYNDIMGEVYYGCSRLEKSDQYYFGINYF